MALISDGGIVCGNSISLGRQRRVARDPVPEHCTIYSRSNIRGEPGLHTTSMRPAAPGRLPHGQGHAVVDRERNELEAPKSDTNGQTVAWKF